MSPNDPCPPADCFCPWCGLMVSEKDYEDSGQFNAIIRCPRCDRLTVISTETKNYDYGRNRTDRQMQYEDANKQARLTVERQTAMLPQTDLTLRIKDDCEVCKGESGGVQGNENIINGTPVCDYCSAKIRKGEIPEPWEGYRTCVLLNMETGRQFTNALEVMTYFHFVTLNKGRENTKYRYIVKE